MSSFYLIYSPLIKQFGDVIMAMQKGHILHFFLFSIEIRLRMMHILVFIYHLCIIVERKKTILID